MSNSADGLLLFDHWNLDQELLYLLQSCFDANGLVVQRVRFWLAGEEQWVSSRGNVCDMASVPLQLLPDRIVLNVVREDFYLDVYLDRSPSADRCGAWPASFSTSTRILALNEERFSFANFAKSLHLRAKARKSIGYTTYHGVDEAEDAYNAIVQEYGGYDLALHPYLDYVIINPADYGEDILDILRDIHFIWADGRGVPRPDPFPRELENLENGHLFLKFGDEL